MWEKEERPAISLSEMILYKLHVRGYTSHKNSKVRQKGTFQGVEKKIPYLKELGITSVELMPCYEFDEIMVKDGIPAAYAYEHKDAAKVNCWGYTDKAFYFAPKASYCATGRPAREFMEMVRAFHQAGIECIMEFYFTGEISSLEVLDILRYWKTVYHIDGFHLVGTPGRRIILQKIRCWQIPNSFLLGWMPRNYIKTKLLISVVWRNIMSGAVRCLDVF